MIEEGERLAPVQNDGGVGDQVGFSDGSLETKILSAEIIDHFIVCEWLVLEKVADDALTCCQSHFEFRNEF